ncbi:DUF5916 domain-containing protein [Paraglaciecola psychrophila]|nr:DUF5916 domain-containing protein [Paraglaciecola psychrophila]
MNQYRYLGYIFSHLMCAFNAHSQDMIIDGVLDENQWQLTLTLTKSYQVLPQTLVRDDNQFSYRLLTTDKGIYLGLTAKTQKALRVRTQENDSIFSNDHFQVMLDMKNNEQQSYVFAINHQGNYFDGIYDVDKVLDLDWDTQWDYKVTTNDNSWVAEVFIPWSAMSFGIEDQNQFGVYVSRFDESSNATYASEPANPQMNSFFQRFSKYSSRVLNQTSFDLFPYVSFNQDFLNTRNSESVGAEVFWQPSKGQRLSATLNPDFGQVESDELVVNFSAIENFFSEKRPFFNHNQSLFEVTGPETLTLVHSPRIGGNNFYDEAHQSELHSALKYTLNSANYDVGVLSAFEKPTTRGDGRDFLALRGQYSFGASKVGLSLNHVNTPNIDRQATVLSSDIHYAITDNTSLNLGIIKANIKQYNKTEADIGWWLTGSSDIAGQHTHEFSMFSYGEHLQLNDIGFVKRVNRKQFEYQYQYQIPNVASTLIRDITFALETEIKTNFQHEKLPHVIGAAAELLTQDEFEYGLSIEMISSGFDDLVTRGNLALWLPSSQILELEVASAEYLWGQYEFELALGTEGWNGYFYDMQTSIAQQLNQDFNVSFTVSQYHSNSWVDWDQDNMISEFSFTEQGVELSMDYQIDANQELRIKFEAVIGKANNLNTYVIQADGSVQRLHKSEDFAFGENTFQLRYKYSFSKLTALYLSYGFGGEYEDELAKFGKRNLYTRAIKSKNAHNLFGKIRLHF